MYYTTPFFYKEGNCIAFSKNAMVVVLKGDVPLLHLHTCKFLTFDLSSVYRNWQRKLFFVVLCGAFFNVPFNVLFSKENYQTSLSVPDNSSQFSIITTFCVIKCGLLEHIFYELMQTDFLILIRLWLDKPGSSPATGLCYTRCPVQQRMYTFSVPLDFLDNI